MSIPGIDSILYEPGTIIWPGEQAPSARLVELIDRMNREIERDLSFDLTAEVGEMARMELEPSQDMRLGDFQAYLLRDNSVRRDFGQAYQFFDHALQIAREHEDLDSQVVLLDQRALMKYGLGFSGDAIPLYEKALALWQRRAQQIANPLVEPEIHFRERLGTTQFITGAFDAAAGSLARTLTIFNQRSDIPKSLYLQTVTAKALWTLGLTHRAQSDMQDGSESLLTSAIERMLQTIDLFKEVGRHEHDLGRIHIQTAETLLDLSDLYLQNQQDKQAGDARVQAMRHIIAAKDAQRFSDADDPWGRPLAELARLRHQITRLPDIEAIREVDDFDERLKAIALHAAEKNQPIVVAKAAALRGEWLLWLGDTPHARESFLLALADLHSDNMGEATRVQRLLRRSNSEAPMLRVRHTRATGPRVSRPRTHPDASDNP